MNNWIKENKHMVILSYVVILVCIGVGLILWPQLPEQIPTHFDASGTPNGWSGRFMAVIGLPLILLAVQALMLFVTKKDPKSENQPAKMNRILVMIIPILCVIIQSITLSYGLGHTVKVNVLLTRAMGVLFLLIGNYLPKVRSNYTVGIRLPWTLADEGNWHATHRVGGFAFAAAGILMLLASFLKHADRMSIVMLAAVLIAVLVPSIYSYWYSTKHLS
ncbi:MAG: SdpI family protein [Catenisphaera adipataccumulans]|jgi:uncharacterized membrane protein|uniref:SdpI family protein n=1 Tax=Catenisphaera adipataccumulans TaxID=700500 RepID=UPI003D8B16EE